MTNDEHAWRSEHARPSQLIEALMHYLPQDVRGKVMHEVPAAYNAYCGHEVVVTSIASERERQRELAESIQALNGSIEVRETGQPTRAVWDYAEELAKLVLA